MGFDGVVWVLSPFHSMRVQQNHLLLSLPRELLLRIASLLIDPTDVIRGGEDLLFFKSVCKLTYTTLSQDPFISKAIQDAKDCVFLRKKKWEGCQLIYDNVEQKIETALRVAEDAYHTFRTASTIFLQKPTLANWEIYKKARTDLEHAEVQAAEQTPLAQQLNSLGLSMLEILSLGKESRG